MPAERAGYTVTIFLIDVSPSMGNTRSVDTMSPQMTNLEWSLQFVLLKVQEMIFNGRKTDQCGVILFGTEDTSNIVNRQNGGYDHVTEYISVGHPNAATLAKLQALRPSTVVGDPIDAIIVGIETQDTYLGNKKSWTRKMVLITDGENPIEIEDWEATVKKMNSLDIKTTIIGVDFDDEEFQFQEEAKSNIKTENEKFFAKFVENLKNGVLGTCAFALQECVRPEVKVVKSALSGYVLRLGDVSTREDEALEVLVKTSKCTAIARPASMKKFARRGPVGGEDVDEDIADEKEKRDVYVMLKMHTEYVVDRRDEDERDENGDEEDDESHAVNENNERVDKEQLVRGFKYGSSYAPCPDGQFPRLNTQKGIDICGFFSDKNLRRDWSMSEVQYVWADPGSGQQQVAFSSIVQAMLERGVVAFARWVTKDGMDPKMGILVPRTFEKVDCFLWLQMPFADDVRKYTFQSLENLVSKKGEKITTHPYIPTGEQMEAMDKFVDAMDLMQAGDKDEEGMRMPWFDVRLSFNPAVHRIKQALFHAAVVTDLETNPLPPPHPEVIKYLEPPKRVLKRAHDTLETCKTVFKVREVPKKIARKRKDSHVRAEDDNDEEMLLLDSMPKRRTPISQSQSKTLVDSSDEKKSTAKVTETNKKMDIDDSDTEPESDDDGDAVSARKGQKYPFPAMARTSASASPPLDDVRIPGRIIGRAHPLNDFRKNIQTGDIVTKAVEDFAWVIKDIVMRPFATRREGELLECMKALRITALNEDEIDAWNDFLRDLKKSCLSTTGIHNREFWQAVAQLGGELSLISSPEAAKLGGKSSVSESEATQFVQT